MDINLFAFCSDQAEAREYLKSPFRSELGVVATNGHILVVTEDNSGDWPATPKAISGFAKVISSATTKGKKFKLSGINYPDDEQCIKCKGEGYIRQGNCYACGQEKEDLDCEECRDGKAKQSIWVGHAVFDLHYIRLISQLPNSFLTEPATPFETARFDFDKGYGCVMPCRKQSDYFHHEYAELVKL